MEPEGSLPWSQKPTIPRPYITFLNKMIFYGEDFLALSPKLEDHTLSAVSGTKWTDHVARMGQ